MAEDDKTDSEFVEDLSPDLVGRERRELQRLGQQRDPVVWVGRKGISEGLVEDFENQLDAHELVKVKVHDAGRLREAARELHDRTGAQLAQVIGKNLVFYRRHPEEPEVLS